MKRGQVSEQVANRGAIRSGLSQLTREMSARCGATARATSVAFLPSRVDQMSEWKRHPRWARVCPVSFDDIVVVRVNNRVSKPMKAGEVNWDNTERNAMVRIREYRVIKSAERINRSVKD